MKSLLLLTTLLALPISVTQAELPATIKDVPIRVINQNLIYIGFSNPTRKEHGFSRDNVAYDRSYILEEAKESLLLETQKEYEIILVIPKNYILFRHAAIMGLHLIVKPK